MGGPLRVKGPPRGPLRGPLGFLMKGLLGGPLRGLGRRLCPGGVSSGSSRTPEKIIVNEVCLNLFVQNSRLVLRQAREGEAREGEAREGEAREGEAREGEAREGAGRKIHLKPRLLRHVERGSAAIYIYIYIYI